jgi:hypothetical protein
MGNHSGGLMIADSFVFSLEFYERYSLRAPLPPTRARRGRAPPRSQSPAPLRHGCRVAREHQACGRRTRTRVSGGDFETFRPTWRSDRIEFGGRKGFIRLALEEGVPIVQVIGEMQDALLDLSEERTVPLVG